MKKPKRSEDMSIILELLESIERSAAWLGRNLDPPVSRQTVSDWYDVPVHYIEQVGKLLDIEPASVRPDLAEIFEPKPKPSRKRAA